MTLTNTTTTTSIRGRVRTGVPPHSAAAEESVIGAVSRSRSAAGRRVRTPQSRGLPRSCTPHDLWSDTSPLRRQPADRHRNHGRQAAPGRGTRPGWGCQLLVVGFWDAAPSAANVGYYTHVVEEHAPRRGMLKASRQSTELATNLDTEVDVVLDQAEQRMLAVANDRAGEEPHDGGPSTTAVRHQRCDRYWRSISGNSKVIPRLRRRYG